ncbi:formylglycine-generating enzyme family protein [Blastopirellula marina]|uniref:Sulfatase-modifying factor enzyme-like domain-containing protein n=1 Tax=Blastopirellula marina TaxID=124 RepID=A0A2S8GHW2_9BACT|nr:SUMF1/EgtB/PvdO family nonheme iron enzyme [Blastopirellula marina]PQO43604.1 hypothetical protein C5Y93_23430 [Blastopirellula marina]
MARFLFAFAFACFFASDSPLLAEDRLKGDAVETTPIAANIEFVRIAPGSFVMGFSSEKRAGIDEAPRHHVQISKPFFAGKFEVTIGQILDWLNSTDVKPQEDWVDLTAVDCPIRKSEGNFVLNTESRFGKSLNHPIVGISWNGANAFCQWCSLKDPNFRYRLPTEAEWEYIARSGKTTDFPWGGWTCNGARANIDGSNHQNSIPGGISKGATIAVGSYNPNDWGLYDTVGNAKEWCADWYGEEYYSTSPKIDPKGPLRGKQRVVRGGGWRSIEGTATNSFRLLPEYPNVLTNEIGFRVVADEKVVGSSD